jgi:hypothetical protein
MDDPATMLSVTETDANGRYRLTNIPAGKYFIAAGRLDQLTYFPGATDPTKAEPVTVEPARITGIAEFAVPTGSKRTVAPAFSLPQADTGMAAYVQIAAEKNPEARKKLLLNFEKKFPKSSRLAEVFIDLSRLLASQSDFRGANDYAEKAVAAVAFLKGQTPSNFDQAWHNWVASLETSARDNLTWTKQMVDWQQKQLNAAMRRR